MTAVKSIERFSLTLGDNVLTADGTLTKGQATPNCVPLIAMLNQPRRRSSSS